MPKPAGEGSPLQEGDAEAAVAYVDSYLRNIRDNLQSTDETDQALKDYRTNNDSPDGGNITDGQA